MSTPYDLICLSHLRWNFVYQRPQHLMHRFAKERRVFYIEEPYYDSARPRLEVTPQGDGVTVVVPHLPENTSRFLAEVYHMMLLDDLILDERINRYVLWYYTPMARAISRHLTPLATVYDCMDELAAFQGAPTEMQRNEHELLVNADLVFTGGASLYHAKRHLHPRVFAMPSSVDAAHFATARQPQPDRPEQAAIGHTRIGFYGVLDERFDRALLAAVAEARPDWSFMLIGPVAKIDRAALPQRANIHYLGQQAYTDLPAFLAGWDVAIMPFAQNDATRFISPTKTLEYLAAGQPVVSTSITDVVHPYGDEGLVQIADTPADFVAAIEAAMQADHQARRARIDAFLRHHSWDHTWQRMNRLLNETVTALDMLPVLNPVALATDAPMSLPLPLLAHDDLALDTDSAE